MVTAVHEKDKKSALIKVIEELSIKKGSRIALKPNLGIQKREACTDFELLKYLL